MVERCAVISCETGSKWDRRRRKKANLRHLSIFKVPRCPILRQKWVVALNQPLAATNGVCELHFLQKDIKKSESFVIDGDVTTIHHLRWRLHPNAVPIPVNSSAPIKTESDQEAEPSQQQEKNQHIQNNQLETQPQIELGLSENPTENTSSADCNEVQISEVTTVEDEPLHDIITPFKAVIPEGWLYYKKSPDIIFVFFDVNNSTPKIQLRLTPERIAMVSFQQRDELKDGITISSADDMYEVMTQLTTLTLCDGTGIDNSYATTCTGLFDQGEFQRLRRCHRCQKCTYFRQILLRKQQREKSRLFLLARKHGSHLSNLILLES